MTRTILLPDTDEIPLPPHSPSLFYDWICPSACSGIVLLPCCSIQPTKTAECYINCRFSEQHCQVSWALLDKGSSRSQQGQVVILSAASYFMAQSLNGTLWVMAYSEKSTSMGPVEGTGSMILNEGFMH